MEHFGLKMSGTFIAEVIPYLKDFVSEDIGRFVYITAEDKYYFGTAFNWVQVGLTEQCIKYDHIDFGFLYNQVNATHIPFKDTFLKSKTVSNALKDLSAGGNSFQSNCIFPNHISDKCIESYHINFGVSNKQVNAKNIPIVSLLNDDITDVQTSIQKLEQFYIQIVRNKILKSDWDYDYVSTSYIGHVTTNPIINKPILIQCYDKNNNMIFPKKIWLDTYYSRAYVSHTEAIDANIVMLG